MACSHFNLVRISLFLAPLAVAACGDDDNGLTAAATETESSSASDSMSSTSSAATSTTSAGTSGTTASDEPATTSATDSDSATTGEPQVPGCQASENQVRPSGRSLHPVIGTPSGLANAGNNPNDWQAEPDDPDGGPIGFISDPDGGGMSIECSVWEQDCPKAEKCMPWANDGGNAWNATRCSPIDVNPDEVGETCAVEGSGVSGVDSCDGSSMCWGVDADTNEGTCIAFCEGSEVNPTCDEPNSVCSISNEGVLILCLPICNPLSNECPAGLGCYSTDDIFACAPDASGEMGAAGDPCEFVNACDNGLACVNSALVPGCTGAAGCCSNTCQVGDDGPCEAEQTCIPWWDDGQEPLACLEGVGICGLPS